MRTIDEILNEMIAEKERHPELDRLTNKSSVSIWRLMLYIVAVIANTVEKLFDLHKSEIEELIKQLVPGRAEWYARKALDFLKDELLPDGSDIYDTTNLTDEEIENMMEEAAREGRKERDAMLAQESKAVQAAGEEA